MSSFTPGYFKPSDDSPERSRRDRLALELVRASQPLFFDRFTRQEAVDSLMKLFMQYMDAPWALLFERTGEASLATRSVLTTDNIPAPDVGDVPAMPWLHLLADGNYPHRTVLPGDGVPVGFSDRYGIFVPISNQNIVVAFAVFGSRSGADFDHNVYGQSITGVTALTANLLAAKYSSGFMDSQTVAADSRDMTCTFTQDRRIISVDAEFTRIFAPEQHASPRSFIHTEDHDLLDQAMDKAFNPTLQNTDDIRVLDRTGGIRIMRCTVGISMDMDETVTYHLAGRDITEHRWTHDHLRENREFLQSVVDNVLEGIITIDISGIITTMNPAAEKIFGVAERDMKGKNVSTLMPAPYRGEHDGYLSHYLETGERRVIGIGREVTGLRSDGTTFPMELAVSEMEALGRRGFIGIVRDITERKRVERMKSEFISMVSHELRTPLTSIIGSLGLVTGGAAGELPDKAMSLVQIAHKNGNRLVNLINDILDLEKMEAGKMLFSLRSIDLPACINDAVAESRGLAFRSGVGITVEKTIPAIVYADQGRLMQVMGNLLSNAIKFSPDGVEVRVGMEEFDDSIRVYVSDSGPGIPEEFRCRIFERFAQADSSNIRSKGGTGLGLAISRMIIERLGGTIGYDTEVGHGTTFRFDLPKEHTRDDLTRRDEREGYAFILHVEDDLDNMHVVRDILRPVADIAGVFTMKEARRILDSRGVDLVLLDNSMPDGNGIELVREYPGVRFVVYASDTSDMPDVDNVVTVLLKSRTSNERLRKEIASALADEHGGESNG